MLNGMGMGQPLLGCIAAALTVGLSLAISASFDAGTFGTWVAFLAMCAIPVQMIIGLVWRNVYPSILGRLAQPARGVVILVIMACVAGIVAPLALRLVGGGATPPTPFLIMYIIMSIASTFWLVAVFQCWPMSALSTHPALVGMGTLMLAYLTGWVVFRLGFDFSAMSQAPFYAAALDPKGAFDAWNILCYVVCTVCVIMGLVLLDYWPFMALAARLPALGRQPWLGVAAGAFSLAVGGLMWWVGVRIAGMDVVDFMVRIPISVLFGNFIVLVLFQTAPLQRLAQPAKGLGLILLSTVLALAMYALYRGMALAAIGDLAAGPPAYGLDLWIATAMLSITFPVIVAYGEGFGLWPFAQAASGAGGTTDQ